MENEMLEALKIVRHAIMYQEDFNAPVYIWGDVTDLSSPRLSVREIVERVLSVEENTSKKKTMQYENGSLVVVDPGSMFSLVGKIRGWTLLDKMYYVLSWPDGVMNMEHFFIRAEDMIRPLQSNETYNKHCRLVKKPEVELC